MYENMPTTSTLTGSSYAAQAVQLQSSITSCREVTEKYLHTLAEEIAGLNGTFAPVLRSKAPEASGNPQLEQSSSCEMVQFLNSINSRINSALDEVRSLRERCEL